MRGFEHTILASVIALIGSFVIGTLIAVFRIAPVALLNWVGTAYVEFIRNIPLMLITLIFFIGFPALGITFSGFTAGTIALSVYTAAFIAESIRAGIQSIHQGQMEAARSSGMTYMQAMWHIILPQAIKVVIPPLGNQFINLVKNSSVLGMVAGLDLMYFGDIIASDTFVTFDVYIFVGAFYLLLTIPLSLGVHYLERRLSRSH